MLDKETTPRGAAIVHLDFHQQAHNSKTGTDWSGPAQTQDMHDGSELPNPSGATEPRSGQTAPLPHRSSSAPRANLLPRRLKVKPPPNHSQQLAFRRAAVQMCRHHMPEATPTWYRAVAPRPCPRAASRVVAPTCEEKSYAAATGQSLPGYALWWRRGLEFFPHRLVGAREKAEEMYGEIDK
jgi:hypothetical protein